MLRQVFVMLAAAATLALAGAAHATSSPNFRGHPTAVYSVVDGNSASIGVVVRMENRFSRRSDVELFAAPDLRAGQQVGRAFGGNSLSSIGDADRNCFTAEAARPEPRPRAREGAAWRLGYSLADKRIVHTVRITLRRLSADDDWQRRAAKRLGCYSGG